MSRLPVLGLICWAYSAPACAYVDPGASLLALQGILALIGGLIVFVKHPIRAIKSLWRRLVGGRQNDA